MKSLEVLAHLKLESGYPSWKDLKLFFLTLMPLIFYFKLPQIFLSLMGRAATHPTAASSFIFNLLSERYVTSIHWGFRWQRVVMQKSSPMNGISNF